MRKKTCARCKEKDVWTGGYCLYCGNSVFLPLRHSITAKQGWLSPDGKLYKCNFAGHVDLSESIIINSYPSKEKETYKYTYEPDDILVKLGWLKLTQPPHMLGYGWWPADTELTQAQFNTIDLWAEKHNSYIPKRLVVPITEPCP